MDVTSELTREAPVAPTATLCSGLGALWHFMPRPQQQGSASVGSWARACRLC